MLVTRRRGRSARPLAVAPGIPAWPPCGASARRTGSPWSGSCLPPRRTTARCRTDRADQSDARYGGRPTVLPSFSLTIVAIGVSPRSTEVPMSSPHADPWSRREFLAGASGALGAASLASPDWLAAPTPADLSFAGALQAAQAIRTKRVSSVELTRLVLDRIARLNPRINAIIQVLGDTALAEAKSADQALAAGRAQGLLHGVPVTVKDCFEINGVKTTAGFEPLKN